MVVCCTREYILVAGLNGASKERHTLAGVTWSAPRICIACPGRFPRRFIRWRMLCRKKFVSDATVPSSLLPRTSLEVAMTAVTQQIRLSLQFAQLDGLYL